MFRVGRRLSRIRALVALGLLAVMPPARAAGETDPDFSLDDTVQAGPFHVAPFLVIKDFGYDDNIRLDAENRSGDYTITFGPGARAVVPLGRRAIWMLRDEVDYVRYASETDLNSFNNQLRTKLHVYLRDLTAYFHGEQRNYRDRPSNEIDYRIRNIATDGRFGVLYSPFRRGKIDLFLQRTDFHYDPGKPDVPPGSDPTTARQAGENVARALERHESNVGVEGRIRVRPRTSALLEVRAGRIDFQFTPAHDSSSTAVLTGFEFDPSGPLRGFLKAGVRHLAPDDDALDGFDGFVADAALSLLVAGRGAVKTTYTRDIVFSIYGDNLYYLDASRGLAYEHFVNSRMSIEAGRRFSSIDYPEPIPLYNAATGAYDPTDRRDDIVHDTVTVRYRVRRGMQVGLTVGRWTRNSTFDIYDTSRNTITTLLEYTP